MRKDGQTDMIKLTVTLRKYAKKSMLIKIQPDATICRYLFAVKSLYFPPTWPADHVGGK